MLDADSAFSFLLSQSTEGILRLFWFTLMLEVPRYACGFISLGLAVAEAERRVASSGYLRAGVSRSTSVIVVGHNEAESLERCVRSLHEQTLPPPPRNR